MVPYEVPLLYMSKIEKILQKMRTILAIGELKILKQ